jgi:hypothetical protein
MNEEKLLQNPLPIDRIAAQVVRAARPEDLWRPMPKQAPHSTPIGAVLATAPIPAEAVIGSPKLIELAGKRRDRMVILGYAADQGSGKTARWVVRCDCGNHEHRVRIFRWLGTVAPDMCRECECRAFKLRGRKPSRCQAIRETKLLTSSSNQDVSRSTT